MYISKNAGWRFLSQALLDVSVQPKLNGCFLKSQYLKRGLSIAVPGVPQKETIGNAGAVSVLKRIADGSDGLKPPQLLQQGGGRGGLLGDDLSVSNLWKMKVGNSNISGHFQMKLGTVA